MFVALQISEREKDIISRLREHFNPCEPEIQKIAVRGGAPFFILRVKRQKWGIPWEEVAYAAGRCCSKIIFCSDDRPPDNSPVKPFIPEQLPLHAMMSTALDAICKSDVPAQKIRLGIIDRDAVLSSRLCEAVKYAGSVRIATGRAEAYELSSQHAMEKFGAAVPISNDANIVNECNVIVGTASKLLQHTDAVIFFAGKGSEELCTNDAAFYPGKMNLDGEYSGLFPEGADSEIFAAALYELCGVRTLERTVYADLIRSGVRESIYAAAQEIYRQINLQ